MNKLVALGLGTTAILITTGMTFYLLQRGARKNNTPTLNDIPVSVLTPTPTTTDELINQVGKFIIIPDKYSLSDKEITYLKDNNFKTVFYLGDSINTTNESLNSISAKGLIVRDVNNTNTYQKCELPASAVSTSTANKNQFSPFFINAGDCSLVKKVTDVLQVNCKLSDTQCQTAILETIHSSYYLYFPAMPFAYTFAQPTITTELKNGLTITTWKPEMPNTIEQKAYSIEYLDKAGKRLFASGKISGSNKGDYYLPTTNLQTQEVAIKLRIWYSIGAQTFAVPSLYTTTFKYTYEPAKTSMNSTPVQMSWIPDWGMDAGITSVKNSPKKWHTLSPVWFTPNRNGTLNSEPTVNSGKLIPLLRTNHIRIVPTISLFDADILKDILRNNLERHVTNIVNVVVGNNYDGIDLDYESTYEDDSALLIQFVTLLSERLHAKNKTLSFTAMPKIDDRAIYAFLPQTHKAQDWKAIGAVVDEFRIMAYDYTGQGSKQPGPLSPIIWDELLIQYAIANMPANKVVLALPLYAHGWPKPNTSNLAGTNNDQSLSSGEAKNTISPQHDNIAYMKTHSAYFRESYDPWYKEVRVEVKYNGIERVMYYLNSKAINERLDLASRYGIKGVCYWRIGGERL